MALIRKIEASPEVGRLMNAITGRPQLHGDDIRRLFIGDTVWIVLGLMVIGRGPLPDKTGHFRTRRQGDRRKLVVRPRAALIPKGHPWRGWL